MGSSTSTNQIGCATCCFDYKKAVDKIKIQIQEYKLTLNKNANQFNTKDQKVTRTNFKQAQQKAYNFLKDNQQQKARLLLTNIFNNDKQDQHQVKKVTRQIDFLKNKQSSLNKLTQQINQTQKPKKKADQIKKVQLFEYKLKQIKSIHYQDIDQVSGDSNDYQAYVDRIINEQKTRIQSQQRIQRIQKQKSIIKSSKLGNSHTGNLIINLGLLNSQKQQSVIKEPVLSGQQYRAKFLDRLRRGGSRSGRTFRKISMQQRQFFRTRLQIQLFKNNNLSQGSLNNSQYMKNSNNNKLNKQTNNYLNTNNNFSPNKQNKIHYKDDSIMSNSNKKINNNINSNVRIMIPDQDIQFSQMSYNSPGNYNNNYKLDNNDIGYYLNCNGLTNLDMIQFVKCDWSIVQVLDLQQCDITSQGWKMLTQSKSISLPNLKVFLLFIIGIHFFIYYRQLIIIIVKTGLNKIVQINKKQLQQLNGLKYLSFGWWDKSNQLSIQTKKVLSQYQYNNFNTIKLQYSQF